MPTNKRLTVLTKTEIDSYFSCPNFTCQEQEFYFALSNTEQTKVNTLSYHTQWYFILQLGYFKARKQFFNINLSKVTNDINYITKRYNLQIPKKTVSSNTHLKTRRIILELLDHDDNIQLITSKLQQETKVLTTTITLNPKIIFKKLYQYMANSQLLMLQYSTFQKIISTTI